MALVDYSDSEDETETEAPEAPKPQPAKPAFQKAAPGKIKVDLPSIRPEPGQTENGAPPAKRARTGGAFSGFNSLLPAPKKTAQNAPKAGVSLRTSSEAAFSRNPVPQASYEPEDMHEAGTSNGDTAFANSEKPAPTSEEPKLVGKATRFLPLSVQNKKKKKPVSKVILSRAIERKESAESGQHSTMAKAVTEKVAKEAEGIPKPKRSLFSMQQEEDAPVIQSSSSTYEPMLAQEGQAYLPDEVEQPPALAPAAAVNPGSLEATANDLNLTRAQRRQLFGRNGGKDANVMQFNLNSEYAHNEQLRQAGEAVEHRTVKAIAPGKHSLQQLVNNARTQSDALEDKWAEGRRNQGGQQYGWRG